MIVTVAGTRPELIKTAPIIHELLRRGIAHALVHTGQHYTRSMDGIFFEELDLPEPAVDLEVGSASPARQLAEIIGRCADALERLAPSVVMVEGDTNSVLGGALAAFKLGIPVAHLEAGLRSDDWSMPEEANRVLTGRVATYHFCPTDLQAERLRHEGMTRGIHVVGNSIVDACLRYAERARSRSRILEDRGLDAWPYAVLTLHRPSNVDDPRRLRALLDGIALAARRHGLRVVFPIHPRTAARLGRDAHGAALDPAYVPSEPVGYLDMLQLIQNAAIVLTDSGGIQEEACTLRVPCVTLRANTERPETLQVGANVLCPAVDGEAIAGYVATMLERPRTWANPFGDGRTAQRVADVLVVADAQPAPPATSPMSSASPSGV